MPNNIPTPETLGKFQKLIAQNPIAFTAAVFFLMWALNYTIMINKNSDAEQYWKELYEKERYEKDKLKDDLLYKAGVIERQNSIIKEADSTLRKKTINEAEQILKEQK